MVTERDTAIADNTTYTPGTGLTVATDDIGPGVHYQRMKVSLGADGTAVDLNGDATGGLWAQGAVAHDGIDSGNPVKIGGKTSATLPTAVANGDRVNAWFGTSGQQGTFLTGGPDSGTVQVASLGSVSQSLAGNSYWFGAQISVLGTAGSLETVRSVSALADASAASGVVASSLLSFNGSSWDRQRSTQGVTAGASTDLGILATGVGPGFARVPAAVAAAGATTATVSSKGASQVVFDVAGTFTGFAATVQVSYDGTTYVTANSNQSYIDGLGVTAFGTAITATAVVGRVLVNTWGAQLVRLNVTAVASGTATIVPTSNAIGSIPAQVVMGDVANDGVDTGNPVKIGGRASSVLPTAVSADGDRANLWLGLAGHLVVSELSGTTGGASDSQSSAARMMPGGGTSQAPLTVAGTVFNGTTWDRVRGIDAFKTASGTPDVGLLAANPVDRRYTAVTVATTGSTTLVADTNGGTHALVRVNTATTGTFTFQVTADGTNWSEAETFHGPTDVWVSGIPQTPATGNYRILTLGYRALRATVVTTLGATVSMVPNLTSLPGIITAVNTGPSQHANGQVFVWKRVTATTAQTGTAIWTPATGKRVVLTSLQIGVGGTTAGTCTVWYGASADTTYTAGTDQPVFEHEFAPSATLKPGVILGDGAGMVGLGAVDEVLRLTTTNALTITVIARGYETV